MRTLRLAHQAAHHAREAKEELLRRQGIGTDLPPALCAWRNDQTIGYAMLTTLDNPHAELATIVEAVDAITTGWHADTIALVKEGYSTLHDDPHDTRTLQQRFPTDPTVHECLTISTVTHDHAVYAVLPYTATVGRRIDWHPHDIHTVPTGHDHTTSLVHATLTRHHHPSELTDPTRATERLSRLGFTSIWLPPELRTPHHTP